MLFLKLKSRHRNDLSHLIDGGGAVNSIVGESLESTLF